MPDFFILTLILTVLLYIIYWSGYMIPNRKMVEFENTTMFIKKKNADHKIDDILFADTFLTKYLGLSRLNKKEADGLVIEADTRGNVITMRNMDFNITVVGVEDNKVIFVRNISAPKSILGYYLTYNIERFEGCDYIIELPEDYMERYGFSINEGDEVNFDL